MADEFVHEVEIRTRNADGEEGVVHAEIRTHHGSPQAAADQVRDAAVKGVGSDRMVPIRADR